MIASNTIGSVLFAKSLSVSPTSLQPTVISTASNFISTVSNFFINSKIVFGLLMAYLLKKKKNYLKYKKYEYIGWRKNNSGFPNICYNFC